MKEVVGGGGGKQVGKGRNPGWPLIFLTHAAAGLFFAYETAGALGPDLSDKMQFTDHQIGLLYSAYSIPAFVSIFINGFLNRKLGAPKCIVLLSFIIAIGVSIIASAQSFYVMFIGQLIYGTGASPMFLTATIITGKWFGTDVMGKRQLSVAVGLQFAWMRFHSFAAFVLLPLIAEVNFRLSLCTAAIICWTCFASGLTFYVIDRTKKYSENVFDTVVTEMQEVSSTGSHTFTPLEEEDEMEANYSGLGMNSEINKQEEGETKGGEMTSESKILEEDELDTKVEMGGGGAATLTATLAAEEQGQFVDLENLVIEKEGEMEGEVEGEGEKFWTKEGLLEKKKEVFGLLAGGVKILKTFSVTYWLVLTLMVIFTSDLYTTTAFLTKYLVDIKVVLTDARAAEITSLVCLSNVLTAPLAGWFSGYTGWRVKCLILGSINLVVIHGLFAILDPTQQGARTHAIILSSALGLTQSIMDTNLWPALIFTVPRKDYPFASSLVTLSYNFGLIVFPTFCGWLEDVTHTWLSVNLTFMAFSSCAVIAACVLKVIDMRSGYLLDFPFNKRPAKGES